jgi:TonB family protein
VPPRHISPVFLHLDDTRPDTDHIERAISLREAVVASILFHAGLILLLLWLPTLPWVQALIARPPEPQPVPMTPQQQEDQSQRFVMVEPRIDREALRKLNRPAPLSDLDREARSRERNPNPTNDQPFLRGRSADLTEAQRPAEKPRGQGPSPEPSPPTPAPADRPTPPQTAANTATPPPIPSVPAPTPRPQQTQPATQQPPAPRGGPPPGGALGEALKNLNRYAQDQQLDNPNGGNEVDPAIQFDSKGVEFGPWLRRFVAQVKRNWFVPMAAMSLKGHVVITFNVHKDGRITDLQVLRPSDIVAFNNAALNALATSNPTMALPPEYPADKAFFTVTFYYNESPR